MSRKAYPEYKPSGIEWLGEIPGHWEVCRLRFRAKINPSRSEVNGLLRDTEVSFVPMESVEEYGGLRLEQVKPLDEVSTGYTYFREGDIIVAKITPCFENGKGSIAEDLENGLGFGTTELHVLRPLADMDRRFLFYLTISHAFRSIGAAYMYGAGGQKRVPDDFIRNFRLPIPPFGDQRSIAAFLDRETARIDTLIEKKERQIELLQEKRVALISHAVTKGLWGMRNDECGVMKNKNGSTHHSSLSIPHFKPSGIEWLGEIPEHWEVRRLKFAARILMGQSPNSKDYSYDSEGIPFLQGNAEFTQKHPVPRLTCDVSTKIAPAGALLISVRAPVGAINIADRDYGIGRGLCAVLVRPQILYPQFSWYLLQVIREELFSVATGSTYEAVTADEVAALKGVIPPLPEQRAIAAFLDEETGRIDAMIEKIRKSIDLLREYRTALITAAVTGKIDVMGAC